LVTVLPLPLFTQTPKIVVAVELMVPVLVRVLLSPLVYMPTELALSAIVPALAKTLFLPPGYRHRRRRR
jgi:hypothetical protein